VDTINGFIESYMDPRQTVGSWEGLAYYTASDPVLSAFSDNVPYFEDHMPWNEIYKRKNITSKPVATLINVAVAVGEGGPVTWSGINLPNYQDIRTTHGSKNVVLVNMIETRDQVTSGMTIQEFYLPEYQALMKKYYPVARRMLLYMHEVIGHGSGAVDASLTSDPRNYIGKNYGAWEEARASLVGYHYIDDPKLVEMGGFLPAEQQDIIKAFFLMELQGQLVTLRHAKGEDVLREAHDRADQLIFEYLRQKAGGFEVVNQGGKFYVKITDVGALLRGSSDLLKIVHEAKAKGDKQTVDQYMEMYGNRFNKEWRDNIIARAEAGQIPELVAMVFPKQMPIFDNDGKIIDVKIDNTESFTDQHLRFGKISKTTEVSKEVY
jgi:dipeptidyl-peptidase-3